MSANPTPETGDPNNDTGGVPPMKSTKTLVAAACAALLALALAACGSSSITGRRSTWRAGSRPGTRPCRTQIPTT